MRFGMPRNGVLCGDVDEFKHRPRDIQSKHCRSARSCELPVWMDERKGASQMLCLLDGIQCFEIVGSDIYVVVWANELSMLFKTQESSALALVCAVAVAPLSFCLRQKSVGLVCVLSHKATLTSFVWCRQAETGTVVE